MLRKYGGLSWRSFDNENVKVDAHPTMMHLDKKQGNKKYCVMRCNEGFDYSVDKDLQNDCGSPMKQNPGFISSYGLLQKRGIKSDAMKRTVSATVRVMGIINLFNKILQKLESTNIDVHRRSRESFV